MTLRETTGHYRSINTAIRQATKRWPQLVVADWNAYSAGKPWFGSDGLHLTVTGAEGSPRSCGPTCSVPRDSGPERSRPSESGHERHPQRAEPIERSVVDGRREQRVGETDETTNA